MNETSEKAAGPGGVRTGHRRAAGPVVALACVGEWLVPGLGYAILGRFGRAVVALFGIGLLFVGGLFLDGQLDRAQPGQILSSLAAFACMGVGLPYFAVSGADSLGRGLGDVTSASFEYGSTFLRAAGLIGFLLMLDVFDIAVGRKD